MNADGPRGPVIDRRDLGLRFLGLAAALLAPEPAAAAPTEAPGLYDVVVRTNVMVAMRDGVRLATDLYLPARDGVPAPGRFPVILERTPYGKSQASTRHASAGIARLFASHGYVVAYQDVRGRGASEGQYVKYLSDGDDGFDCCRWIVDQPWCDGKIGAHGLSYGAHTTAALACAGAPGVAALFINSGGFANAYQGGIRQGGAFEMKQVTWALNNAMESPQALADPKLMAALKAVDIKAWFARLPWRRGASPLSAAPEYEDYVFDQWEAGRFDGFWTQLGIYAEGFRDRFVDAPTIWMSSWYDPYPRTATENFVALSKIKRSPMRLVLGPWTHGNNHLTYAGDVDFGPQALLAGNVAPDLTTLRKRWFDRHLKGVANGVDDEPRVWMFVMGGGSGRRIASGRLDHGGAWRAETDWPPPGARPTRFHLQPGGGLAEDVPAHAAHAQFRYDPRHPVPSIGGTITSGEPVMAGGAYDQREGPAFFGSEQPGRALADRPDVLAFATPPLARDMEVTGAVEAELWVATDGPDTDFTIKLLDLYPPTPDDPSGYAMNLTDGILRCRYRDSWTDPRPMVPGRVTRIVVRAFPTSNLFRAGHRIGLHVSSSNYPHFDVNPNTGEPEGRGTRTRVATNRVFMGRARPSAVVLPVMRAAGPDITRPLEESAPHRSKTPIDKH